MPMMVMGRQMAMMMVMGMELAARCVLPTQEASAFSALSPAPPLPTMLSSQSELQSNSTLKNFAQCKLAHKMQLKEEGCIILQFASICRSKPIC